MNSIRNDHKNVVLDWENAYKTISKLEHELESTRFKEIKEENEVDKDGLILKNYQHIETLVEENRKIKTEYISLGNSLKESEANNANLKAIVKKLHSEMSEVRSKHKKEKVDTTKTFKAEIKHWKKELGEERKMKINLIKKFGAPKLAENDFDEHQPISKASPTKYSKNSSEISASTPSNTSFPALASASSQTEHTSDIPCIVTSPTNLQLGAVF